MSTARKNDSQAESKAQGKDSYLGMPVPIWLAIISLISGSAGHFIGSNKPTIIDTAEGEELNKIRFQFTSVKNGDDGKTIVCTGSYSNFEPDKHPIWIAVEVNGHIWFKDANFEWNRNNRTWKASISEGGNSKTLNLLLFAVTDEANTEIINWMSRGIADRGRFQEMTNLHGTVRLDHYDNLVRNDSR